MEQTFEDFLTNKHAKGYTGTDDLMPDDFNNWLTELDPYEMIEYADEFAKKKVEEAKK